MAERGEWKLKACPVHGPTGGGPCREVVERTRPYVRYCHMETEVSVVPADADNVLSPEEARLLATALRFYASAHSERTPALAERLRTYAEGNDR